MTGELEKLKSAARDFVASDASGDDPRELREVIDGLELKFCAMVLQATRSGALDGHSPVSWVAERCRMSSASASDRLCVGRELEAMPVVAQALSSGEIGYQSASVICHLRERLGEQREPVDEQQWIGHAREHSVKNLRWLAEHVRYVLDPDGFEHDVEEDYEQRFLKISEMSGMFHLSGVLDRVAGAALRTAIDSLAKRMGPDDGRSPKQRRADALGELVHHALDQGTLPRRNGVRPHLTLTTTPEGLRREAGASASELENGGLVSSKTAQRLACDGTLGRVLKAGSVVVDVGRATRVISPAQRRGLQARHRGCCWPGCDRPLSWTNPHHIEFWARGGSTSLPNLLPLCYHHHRCVHEGGWQVVKAGEQFRFIPPERIVVRRARGPGMRWAA